MHVLELRNSLVIISRNFTHVFTQFHAILRKFHLIFHAIWTISAILGQFQHVGHQKALSQAENFMGGTFTQVHGHIHAISRKLHAI